DEHHDGASRDRLRGRSGCSRDATDGIHDGRDRLRADRGGRRDPRRGALPPPGPVGANLHRQPLLPFPLMVATPNPEAPPPTNETTLDSDAKEVLAWIDKRLRNLEESAFPIKPPTPEPSTIPETAPPLPPGPFVPPLAQ